ncbi:hypothetical protein GA0111570_10292 [Raineyella antarctica]|uniref:Uncharacterized protein n=1 Tax=Raineyella antarctica TaxID=1577474 RepID=A0A1G6GEY4_9ACTN|nr:hypothetical protein [Raineyella antarctica]SDB80305.1 hypothetical protein GA0111570_10292 [Raineyella antarctica]
MVPIPSAADSGASAAWSPDAYQELVRRGRQFAESVLIHLERLEALDRHSDPRDLEDANIRLEGALLDFQDAQVAYAGRGFDFIQDQDQDAEVGPELHQPSATSAPADRQPTTVSGDDVSEVALGDVVTVLTRHDFELLDQGAVEDTAQQFAELAGATPVPPGDLGYAMAILNYMGLGQLTTTAGLRPLLEVNAVSTRPSSPSREEIAATEGVDDLFDPGDVLNYQTNFWDSGQEG